MWTNEIVTTYDKALKIINRALCLKIPWPWGCCFCGGWGGSLGRGDKRSENQRRWKSWKSSVLDRGSPQLQVSEASKSTCCCLGLNLSSWASIEAPQFSSSQQPALLPPEHWPCGLVQDPHLHLDLWESLHCGPQSSCCGHSHCREICSIRFYTRISWVANTWPVWESKQMKSGSHNNIFTLTFIAA